MNFDDHRPAFALDALARLINAHQGIDNAIEAMIDYCDDPAAISSPAIIADLDTLIEMGADADASTLAETLSALDMPFARRFATLADLCPDHFCDIMICRDDETPHP